MTKKRFTKIQVDGSILVGYNHELVQGVRDEDFNKYRTRIKDSPLHVDSMTLRKNDSLGKIYEHRFSSDPIGKLEISGAGLVTSFGIFGAPGSGKTVLLMHLLEQILNHEKNNPHKKYGALILDPKASLMDDISKMAKDAGREEDLIVINTSLLNDFKQKINLIDCSIEPYELGAILVLAARSAGSGASDPFWFQEWSNLFASTLNILHFYDELYYKELQARISKRKIVTIQRLLEVLFDKVILEEEDSKVEVRKIQRICIKIKSKLNKLPENTINDLSIDIQVIERFYNDKHAGTIEAFISKSFGMFRREKYQCFSNDVRRSENAYTFYDDIVENGKIVLVSISPSEPVLAKTVCTLVKCLFQRTVLSRGELLFNGIINNDERPLIIACDEYSEIASEVPGESMGDGQFLALARQYGCMALFATQSVNVLRASSLQETWRSVFSNFAAKFYMRLVDNETAEEATKLAGESDWMLTSSGQSSADSGNSVNNQDSFQSRKNLPSSVLTHVLKQGEAVVIGSLDGGKSIPGTYFIKVPFK